MPENNQPASEARKSLPQNIEAEQTVLAACLLSTGVFEEVSLIQNSGICYFRFRQPEGSGTVGSSWWPTVSAGAC